MIRIELRKGESLQGINVPLLGGTVSNSSARPMGDLGEESGQGRKSSPVRKLVRVAEGRQSQSLGPGRGGF